MLNQVVLVGTLAREIEFKLNPGGPPVLTVLLRHESEQRENGRVRRVNLNIVTKIIGPEALILRTKIEAKIQAKGFLTTPKLGFKNVVFHIQAWKELN